MSQTALLCLAGVARHRGVDLAVERLAHDYATENNPPTTDLLIRMARENGLRATLTTLTWAEITTLEGALPALLPLRNGNWVVVAGLIETEAGQRARIFDPLAVGTEPLLLDEATLTEAWTGRVLVVQSAAAPVADRGQKFGFRWFVPEIVRQRRLLADVIGAAVILYALGLAVPIFSQLVIDKVLVHETYTTLFVLAVGVSLALIFEAVFTFLRRYFLLYATNRVDIRVAMKTFTHLLSLPLSYFERIPAGVLSKHMQQSARIREFLTGRLLTSLLDGMSLFVFIPVLLLYSVKLTLIVLLFTACVAATVLLLIGTFRRRLRNLYEAEGERQASLVEAIHGMRTVKAMAMEGLRSRAWDNASARVVNMRYEVDRISATAQSLTTLLEKLMGVAIIGFGALEVFDRSLTVGALIAFNMLSARVSGPLVQIITMAHEYQEVALSVRMLGEVMDQPSEDLGTRRGLRPQLSGEIEFEEVSFAYRPNSPPALDAVSFKVPAGSIIGVVGRSGSGKTTITRLIQRLYTNQSGIVRLDGYDIREIDMVHLRKNIGVVLQESFLFRGTIRDNIAAAKPNATFEEVALAARNAGADEFIERLPRGFETELEENAENLSGGQKQRLAIARALIGDPCLLILDEATSALDPESEAIIRKNLRKIAEGRTVIIVSHRLSSIADANAILVLDRGQVSACGRHDQLLTTCPTYRGLWSQQAMLPA